MAADRFALRVIPCPPPSPEQPWLVNAVSAGYNVVGVTADSFPLLNDDELRAILSHEAGHQSGFDSVPRALCAWYLGLIEAIARPIGGTAIGVYLQIVYMPILVVLSLTSRSCEFAADAFAMRLGYGRRLGEVLLRLGPSDPLSLVAAVLASHPATIDRVRRLQSLS